jgi:zinc-ribbon domain
VKTCPNCGQSTRDDDRFCPSCGQPTDPRRQAPLVTEDRSPRRQVASVAASNVAGYAVALRRFWWVLVIGLLFAMFAALSARFTVSFFPPGLDEKEEVSYTAEARLLVNSASNPHFRAAETTFTPVSPGFDEDTGTDAGTGTGSEEEQPPTELVPFSQPPDLNTIIRNANTYPFIIESDGVADYRRQRFGELPGAVSAIGATSVVTANRVELSEIPVIRLVAVAGSPDDAIALADKTGKAFIGWLQAEQQEDNIRRQDRMVVEQLTIPKGALASAGPSTSLPILVFVVVFAAFCVLAILLDRLVPTQPKPARSDVEALEQPVKVKKTA